tara:strand:+ start:170 stop:490 length:321 start_codon:yes stop_codon:yes gene_type:complete
MNKHYGLKIYDLGDRFYISMRGSRKFTKIMKKISSKLNMSIGEFLTIKLNMHDKILENRDLHHSYKGGSVIRFTIDNTTLECWEREAEANEMHLSMWIINALGETQ